MGLVGIPIDLENIGTDKEGEIYFIQLGSIGPIKIGFSKNVENRLPNLQSASPWELELLYRSRGTEKNEKYLHQRFLKWNIRGEWFHPDKEILKYIYSCIWHDNLRKYVPKKHWSFNPPQYYVDLVNKKTNEIANFNYQVNE